jgi:hypothetical protein
MQLLYRGIPYESHNQSAQNPAAPDGTTLLQKRLTYRGHSYNYQPQPQLVEENIESDGFWVTLMYRGQTYQRKLTIPQGYPQPKALNWRWQQAQA